MTQSASGHLVAILIPTYNYGRFIGECLASVAAQTFKDYKVFIQDNASTDDTEAVVRSWQNRLDIEYERNAINLGITGNLAILRSKVHAKYFVRLFSDDLLEPAFLECTVAGLESHSRCNLAFSDWEVFTDSTGEIVEMPVPFRGSGSGIHRDDAALLWNNYITPSFALIRTGTEPLFSCEGMEMLCDHLANFHMAATGELYFVDRKLGRYRKHGANDTDRLFASGKAMDELCVFYGRIYTNLLYPTPLRLLSKICETAKLLDWGLCRTWHHLTASESKLAGWIASHKTELIPLIARMVFTWPVLFHEKREAAGLLHELSWTCPALVPRDLAALIEGDPDVQLRCFSLPGKAALHEVDGEHYAHRMHKQWQIRPRFALLIAQGEELDLSDQIYDHYRIIQVIGDSSVAMLEAADMIDPDDWVILLPLGCKLTPTTLFSLADAINRKPHWQAIYADDLIGWGAPRLKSDFDAVLLAGTDYIGAFVVKASVFRAWAAGVPLSPGLSYALVWQIVGAWGEGAVGHVPEILFSLPATFVGASDALRQACVSARTKAQKPLPECTRITPSTPEALVQQLPEVSTDLVLVVQPGLTPETPDWIEILLRTLMDWNAAAVGPAILLGSERMLEDAGLVLGVGGSLGSMFPGTRLGDPGDLVGRATLPHRVSALSAACILFSRNRLQEAGGISGDYASLSGCLADLCLKLHQAGQTLIWTPQSVLVRTSIAPSEPQESPERFVGRWLPILAQDPFWNRNLSLQTGAYVVESDLVPRWNPDRRDVLRILAMPMAPSGQAEYRVTAPLRVLDNLGLAQVTEACVPYVDRERAPTPIEIARMAPDVLYIQAAVDDVRLQGLLTIAHHNPGLLRVFSLDDRIADIPNYNVAHKKLPRDKVVERMKLALGACQRLIVSTPPLAELYARDISDIRIIPNRLERALWQKTPTSRRRVGEKPRVGWAGALQHEGDLALVAPVVEALADEVEWIFFGMMPKGCEPHVAEYHPPVTPYAAYPLKLASLNLDLALAPLEINLFNEAKSNLRLIEYGFFGWPVIATDIAPYRENDAPVTRVANTPEAWIAAIREHIHDPDESQRRGQQLSDWVQTHYMLEDHPQDWLEALS